MKLTKPWGRAPKGKPCKFFRVIDDGKPVAPLPYRAMMALPDQDRVGAEAVADWMVDGDYVVYVCEDGEYAALAMRDGEPRLWTTSGINVKGENARAMVGPDADFDTCLPDAWMARGVVMLRDAERMFPEIHWTLEWDADALNVEGRDCSRNLKTK